MRMSVFLLLSLCLSVRPFVTIRHCDVVLECPLYTCISIFWSRAVGYADHIFNIF